MHRNHWIIVGMCALALSIPLGCKKGTPTTCRGWAKYIKSPVKAKDAIRNLGELRCKENLSDLESIYDGSHHKEEIIAAVRDINDPPSSVNLLNKALADPSVAVAAAAVAEDFAIAPLRPALLEILTGDKTMKARLNALKALAKIDAEDLAQHEDLFIQLLRNNPNIQGVEVNALAANLLGKIPSEKAVLDLLAGLFVRAQHGGSLYSSCRKALAHIGKPAVDAILPFMNNEPAAAPLIERLESVASQMGIAQWQWRNGPEFIQVLGDIKDPAAAKALAMGLSKPLTPPIGADQRVMQTWRIAQQNRIAMTMIGLWHIGDSSIAKLLAPVVLTIDNDAKQRLDTATTIALLPEFSGIDTLMDIYRKSPEESFRAPLLKPMSLGMDWAHYDDFMHLIASDKSRYVRERATGDDEDAVEFRATMNVIRDCKEKDTNCLIERLNNEDPVIAAKAALLLASMKDVDRTKALDALFNKYPATDPRTMIDLRRFILLAIWRLADASHVPNVQALLNRDRDHKGAGYWIDELETFIPPLSKKTAP